MECMDVLNKRLQISYKRTLPLWVLIGMRYYDERNKAHIFKIKDISDCWVPKHFDSDEEWILLKK